mmetsp:Transcript_21322/g.40588  ORF Transcript_21322/g.40588 Transcript_21322/m.40588 type:complete len:201 (+) Transcript_21322:211-813(+)
MGFLPSGDHAAGEAWGLGHSVFVDVPSFERLGRGASPAFGGGLARVAGRECGRASQTSVELAIAIAPAGEGRQIMGGVRCEPAGVPYFAARDALLPARDGGVHPPHGARSAGHGGGRGLGALRQLRLVLRHATSLHPPAAADPALAGSLVPAVLPLQHGPHHDHDLRARLLPTDLLPTGVPEISAGAVRVSVAGGVLGDV